MADRVPSLYDRLMTRRNQYVTDENTVDESMQLGKRYPHHRLSRERTAQSEAARVNAQEKERVRRVFGK